MKRRVSQGNLTDGISSGEKDLDMNLQAPQFPAMGSQQRLSVGSQGGRNKVSSPFAQNIPFSGNFERFSHEPTGAAVPHHGITAETICRLTGRENKVSKYHIC